MRIVLGRVVGAHGVRGQVRVRWAGDGPDNLLAAEEVVLAEREDGTGGTTKTKIEGGGPGRAGEVRLTLEGVSDREAAQALRGRIVLADVAAIEPLPDGEFYWYELVGCRVETADGRAVGTVRELWETGAHDVLVVRTVEGAQVLIPTAKELLTEIDLENERLVVADLPGLLEP